MSKVAHLKFVKNRKQMDNERYRCFYIIKGQRAENAENVGVAFERVHNVFYKVLSSEMDPAEIRLIR
jgi:hypothetical protein